MNVDCIQFKERLGRLNEGRMRKDAGKEENTGSSCLEDERKMRIKNGRQDVL